MDIRMPGLDGLQATRQLRLREAALGRSACRIVALTANARAEDRVTAREAGLDGLLPKPIDFAALKALLRPEVSLARAG
jgi:CheY-like chemotaxis protein